VYVTPGQQTSMQIFPAHQEGSSNTNQAQMQEMPSQGYVFTQNSSSTPLPTVQGNYTTLCYTPQTPQAVPQSTSPYNAQTVNIPPLKQPAQNYAVQVQTQQELPYSRHQVLTSSQPEYNGISVTTPGYENQALREKLVWHEPCIHSLAKLENDVQVLKKQSAQQLNEIKRLEQTCRRKDTTIAILKQQMSWQEFKIKRLVKDREEKDMSIKSLNYEKTVKSIESNEVETPILNGKQVEGSNSYNKYLTEHASEAIKEELSRLRLWNREVIRLQAKLCKLELDRDEFKRVKKENESQRDEIARLELKLKTRSSSMFSATSSRNLTSCIESSSS